jgi:hypothetical protein
MANQVDVVSSLPSGGMISQLPNASGFERKLGNNATVLSLMRPAISPLP